jgi:hypothetical protein
LNCKTHTAAEKTLHFEKELTLEFGLDIGHVARVRVRVKVRVKVTIRFSNCFLKSEFEFENSLLLRESLWLRAPYR